MTLVFVFAVLISCAFSRTEFDKKLRFDAYGNFKLLQITDLHYGEDDVNDTLSTDLQTKLVDAEKPDLVVLTGDMLSDYTWNKKNDYFYVLWTRFTTPYLIRKQPYIYALGNHDAGPYATRREIMERDVTHPFSLSEVGPADISGAGNYVKAVWDSKGERIQLFLWVLDSGKDSCMGKPGWGCIEPDQVKWFSEKNKELQEQEGRAVPSFVFFHIPPPEVLIAEKTSRGLREAVCCSSANSGAFEAFRQAGNVKLVAFGHDHKNDYSALLGGIYMYYGRKTGYGGYGPSDPYERGARVYLVHVGEDGEITWETTIRTESGKVVKSGEEKVLDEDLALAEQTECAPYEFEVFGFSTESYLTMSAQKVKEDL